MQRARELFQRKFDALIRSEMVGPYNKGKMLRSRGLLIIKKIYRWSELRNIPIEKWLGVSLWDWQNLYLGRFISRWDFIVHRFSTFYLVQKMPRKILALGPNSEWNTECVKE
jgi:hypothetical protein